MLKQIDRVADGFQEDVGVVTQTAAELAEGEWKSEK